MTIDYSKEFEYLVKAYEKAGGNASPLMDRRYDSLVINEDKTLVKNETEGIKISTKKIKDGVSVKVYIKENVIKELPVHLYFGMLPKEGKQVIKSEFFIGRKSKVKFIAHCSFPNAKHIIHIMEGKVHLDDGAEMEYLKTHYHSTEGGVD